MDVPAATALERTAPSRFSRRSVLGLAVGLALGSIGVPAGLAAVKPTPQRRAKPGGRKPRRRPQRKPRFKIVTRTFTSTVPISIPEVGPASPYPSLIPVSGLRAGTIQDVNVTLSGLTHALPTYVDVVLVAPGGLRTVGLMSDAGGEHEVTNVTLVFDDQAASYLPYDQQIVSGTFKPTLPAVAPTPDTARLSRFAGLNPNGTWRLYVANANSGDLGSIAGWALTIKARVRV